jgi:hypothetical protein
MLQGLEQYVTYVRSLHLVIGDLSEGEKMDRFLRGLKPKLQERLRAMRPHARTFEELVQRALVLDDAERAGSASTRAFPSGGNCRSYTTNPAKAQQHPRHADSDEYGAPMELGSMSNGNKGKFWKDERGENRQHRDIANIGTSVAFNLDLERCSSSAKLPNQGTLSQPVSTSKLGIGQLL